MIGVINGEMIMAPITEATESPSKPQVAMIEASVISTVKRISRCR